MLLTTRWIKLVALAGTALVLASVSLGASRTGKEATLEQLTKGADAIIVGDVVSKKVNVVDRRFETDYDISVKEQLKGADLPPGRHVTITVPGGELTTPPLTMYVELQAYMVPKEEVVLFLSTRPRPVSPELAAQIGPTKLLTTPRVIGGYEGKFSVLTDVKDGRKRVTRLNLEQYGFVPQDPHLQSLLRAVASGDVPATSAPVVDLGGGLHTTEAGKHLLDTVYQDNKGEKPKLKATDSQVIDAVRSRRNIKLQDFDEFKSQISSFAKPQ
jgi:hypothetical protein